MRLEHSKKANEVLSAVKDDLKSEQGQLLIRVLTTLTKVNAQKAAEKAVTEPAKEEPAPQPISRQDRE